MIVSCRSNKNKRVVSCRKESTLTKKLECKFSKVFVESYYDVEKVFYDVVR